MPVEEDIDLNTITEEELNKLVGQADKLEKAAKKAEAAKMKIENLVAGLPPIASEEGGPAGGVFGGEVERLLGFKQGQQIGGGTRGLSPRAGGGAPQDLIREGIFEKIKENEKEIVNLKGLLGQAMSAAGNPIGFAQGALLGVVGKVLPIGAAIAIITITYQLIKQAFGPGGIFDIRKLVKDEVREYFEINILNAVNRGDVFVGTGGALLSQSAPIVSNTQSKQFGHLQDILLNPGH